MSDDQRGGDLDPVPSAAESGYEPPKLSIHEIEAPVEWAALRQGESAPDDLLQASPSSDGSPSSAASPEVLRWSAPRPDYDYPDPEVFVAPADPSRKVSGKKKAPTKTKASGMVTRAHTTKTKLTGHDAFGGTICTCNLVCTCNQVCTCESVAACSCVSDSGGGGGGSCACVNDVCTCQGVSNCSCVNHTCTCQAEL